ncbi:hypothetical protein CA54_46760 [Symmachiella macrocystis]|uniref:PEP-CTERM protein-sorting domain-containing protein n=1 Tax=Symmachiella macrocystis TaxID=2527985 RepID=A0A5C6BG63_9PLAN|nr:PEP-CTERM sorting domain-containing protein [Symmachiella macrocystis]TWU09434.1 hypothetical protein CA54_46760 [Symmachiella macrocystis]
MKRAIISAVASVVVLLSSEGRIEAEIITFDLPSNTWQTDFDTAEVDIEFRSHVFPWPTGYNDLTNVAYTDSGSSLIIDLRSINNALVTLNQFDLGNSLGNGGNTQYHIYDLSDLNNPILSVTNLQVPYSTNSHSTFSVNLSSNHGIRLQVGPDLNNIGIDNIIFNEPIAVVPEPSTYAGLLGITCVSLLAYGWWRKRQQAA